MEQRMFTRCYDIVLNRSVLTKMIADTELRTLIGASSGRPLSVEETNALILRLVAKGVVTDESYAYAIAQIICEVPQGASIYASTNVVDEIS